MQKQANGPHDVGLLMAIDGLIRSSDRDKLATLRLIDPGSAEQVPAGVYWVRACVDRDILEELGRDPAAMTRKEYLRQGASFKALCAAWVFAVEVEQERARHEAALKRQYARAAKALLGQVGVNGHVY